MNIQNFNRETYSDFKVIKTSENKEIYNYNLQYFIDNSLKRLKEISETKDICGKNFEFIECRDYYNDLIKTLPNYDYLQYLTLPEWVIYKKEKKSKYKNHLKTIPFTCETSSHYNEIGYFDGLKVNIDNLSENNMYIDMPYEYFKMLPVTSAKLYIEIPKTEVLLSSSVKEQSNIVDIKSETPIVKIIFFGNFDFTDLESAGPCIDMHYDSLKFTITTETTELTDGNGKVVKQAIDKKTIFVEDR